MKIKRSRWTESWNAGYVIRITKNVSVSHSRDRGDRGLSGSGGSSMNPGLAGDVEILSI